MDNKKEPKRNTKRDIAIVGISCRFPGAKNYREFWNNLANGAASIREIDRWNFEQHYTASDEENKCSSKWLGMLEDIDKFDNNFFNISPREANHMDPQQRILLEETWHCIEDAGVALKRLQEKRTAVYIGALSIDPYFKYPVPDEIDIYSGTGIYPFMLANRISYFLGLNGESKTLDTACASAFVALHDARRAILSGEIDYALVGGINLHFSPLKYLIWSKNRMLSPVGKCKTFGMGADGFVAGEGIGVVLLQPLEQAIADRSHIYGVINGSAVNHGGKGNAIFAPRVEAQRDVILDAYKDAGYTPETVSYIEAHGTGTSLGDPIEIEALTQAFEQYTQKKKFCRIGSVKTNIGHLMAAAAMPSLIKVLLMLQNKKVPASLNVDETNPIINFDSSPFTIAKGYEDWVSPERGMPLRAGISSFGYGGVNSHVLVEEYCGDVSTHASKKGEAYLFTISAKTQKSLEDMVNHWTVFLKQDAKSLPILRDTCLTLLTGREAFPYRFCKWVKNHADLLKTLESVQESSFSRKTEGTFCLRIGEGQVNSFAEWEALCKEYPLFENKLTEILRVVENFDEDNKITEGLKSSPWAKEYEVLYSFILMYSAVLGFMELGLEPQIVTGYKNGVWIGLAISKILSLEEILMLLVGKIDIQHVKPNRPVIPFYDNLNMKKINSFNVDTDYFEGLLSDLSISDEILVHYMKKARSLYSSQFTFKKYMEEWNQYLKPIEADIKYLLYEKEYLAENSDKARRDRLLTMVIVLGSLCRLNQKWNISGKKLLTDNRFYELLDLVVDDVIPKDLVISLLTDENPDVKDVSVAMNDRIDKISVSSQKPYWYLSEYSKSKTEIADFPMWIDNILKMNKLPELEGMAFVDFGKLPNVDRDNNIAILRKGKLPQSTKKALSDLWLGGVDIKWGKLYSAYSFNKVQLPVYPFEQNSFWLPEKKKDEQEPKDCNMDKSCMVVAIHPLLHQNTSSLSCHKFTSAFTINDAYMEYDESGKSVFPPSALLEMAHAAIKYSLRDSNTENEGDIRNGLRIQNMVWGHDISLGLEPVKLQTGLVPWEDGSIAFEIFSGSNKDRVIHAQGYARPFYLSEVPVLNIEVLKANCSEGFLSQDRCYELLYKMGANYSDSYKAIAGIYQGVGQVLVAMTLPESTSDSVVQFTLHPAIIDASLQAIKAVQGFDESSISLTVLRLEEVEVFNKCSSRMWSLIKYSQDNSDGKNKLKAEIELCNEAGNLCIKIKGLELNVHVTKVTKKEETACKREINFLNKKWELCPEKSSKFVSGTVAILATEETRSLAELVLQNFMNARILDYSDLKDEFEKPKHEWKNYTGLIDLTGCGNQATDGLDWIKWLQLLIEYGHKDGLMLLCVTCGLEAYQNDSINLAGASRVGLYRILQSEYRHLYSRHMDLEATTDNWSRAAQITKEFLMKSEETEVCYRGDSRYKSFLGEIQGYSSGKEKIVFPKEHVLFITGGTRGLGYLCASHFADKYAVKRMVLLGKEKIPPREQWDACDDPEIAFKVKNIRELEAKGVQVKVLSTSLTDAKGLHQSLNDIKNTMGPIGGVIHCAGVTDTENPAFIRKTIDRLGYIFDPKIRGLDLLYSILKNEPLKFFILFSSVSAILPTLATGQSDYAMANAYMDYFAQEKNKDCPIISIQWPSWKETGIGEVKNKAYQQTGLLSHTNEEGLNLLDTILSNKLVDSFSPVILPAVVNPDMWKPEQLMAPSIQCDSMHKPEPVMSVAEETKGSESLLIATQGWLISLFSKELNMAPEKLKIDTPFQNFGIDSIFLAQIIKQMDKEINNISIEPSALLEYSTIKSFADFMVHTHADVLTELLASKGKLNTVEITHHGSKVQAANTFSLLSRVQDWLIGLFSKELSISRERLDINKAFQDFGIDSIFLAQIIKQMDKELGCVTVEPSSLLEYPTINKLSGFMLETYHQVLASLFSDNGASGGAATPLNETERPELTSILKKGNEGTSKKDVCGSRNKVAIVGMACHFPDAPNIEEYWSNLRSGRDSIRVIPRSRWEWEKNYCNEYMEGKSISKWGAFLDNIQEFDPDYFKISKVLAPQIDPLQRQWLEVSVEALADAGYEKESLWGKQVGVFVGARTATFSRHIKERRSDTIVGTGQNFIAVHLAHIMNFKGPNMVVDTACSSSLTAIHLAVKSIQNGESEIALAGGVDILDEPVYLLLSMAKILSPDGRCKTFDAGANGIGVGEGCGVLVLKSLDRAIRDNDKIYGVIDSSAINNDGNTMGVTTPNPEAQKVLIETAIASGNVPPDTITYIETHGTGTLIGDPIELRGLTRIFEQHVSKKQFCGVGSVKSNIGHILSAAGAASIIKVLLSMVHSELPPTLHCDNPNPRFNFNESPLYLIREVTPWKGEKGVLRAGISAFGLGGNNAHIIVSNEGIPETHKATLKPRGKKVVFNRSWYWPEEYKEHCEKQPPKESVETGMESFTKDEEAFLDFFKVDII